MNAYTYAGPLPDIPVTAARSFSSICKTFPVSLKSSVTLSNSFLEVPLPELKHIMPSPSEQARLGIALITLVPSGRYLKR